MEIEHRLPALGRRIVGTIATTNAAFFDQFVDTEDPDNPYHLAAREMEVNRLLAVAIGAAWHGATDGMFIDYNGNAVGTWELEA